jgi:hypothetical protein
VQKYPFAISHVLQASASTPVGLGPTSQNSLPVTGAKKFSLLPHSYTRHLFDATCKIYVFAPEVLQTLQFPFPAPVQPVQDSSQAVHVLTLRK